MVRVSFVNVRTGAQRLGMSRSTYYGRAARGLVPPPISLGIQKSGLAEHELDEVARLILRGAAEAEIAACVARLVADRQAVAA